MAKKEAAVAQQHSKNFSLLEINECVELWVQGKGRFAKRPKDRVDLTPGLWFENGSTYSDGVEVTRLVKAKKSLKNHALPGWAIARKDGTQLAGHSYFREMTVGVIPNKAADHDTNRAWYLTRIGKVMSAKMAIWNRFRTALAVRKAMLDYASVYDVQMPGPSREEVATLAQLKIIPDEELKPEDLEKIAQAYAKLYGPNWASESDVVLGTGWR